MLHRAWRQTLQRSASRQAFDRPALLQSAGSALLREGGKEMEWRNILVHYNGHIIPRKKVPDAFSRNDKRKRTARTKEKTSRPSSAGKRHCHLECFFVFVLETAVPGT